MAETLTYDSGVDTESREDNLTPDEQDSLKVGTEIVNEQEQLLAGKYENAQELEKAYIELEKKLGSNDQDNKAEAEQEEVLPEESEESSKESSPAVALITEASEEYWNNDGNLAPETVEKFSSMSSKDLVNAYLEIQKNNPQQQAESQGDLSEAAVNNIQNSVGGEQEYQNLVNWASQNLNEQEVGAFDSIINTGNTQAIQLAVAGLKSKYDSVNGSEGVMYSGKAAKSSGQVFRSQAEVVEAMSDVRYDRDPAYRRDILDKLERSDLNF